MLFLIFTLPICIWVAHSDMSRMKIPNYAVLALAGVFLILGLFVMPFQQYLWQIAGGVVVLGIGFLLNQFRVIGAGDAKFAAAMAPFVAHSTIPIALIIFSTMLLVAFAVHRIARAIPAVRRATPNWESWTHKKFPMGLALSLTLFTYLLLPVILG